MDVCPELPKSDQSCDSSWGAESKTLPTTVQSRPTFPTRAFREGKKQDAARDKMLNFFQRVLQGKAKNNFPLTFEWSPTRAVGEGKEQDAAGDSASKQGCSLLIPADAAHPLLWRIFRPHRSQRGECPGQDFAGKAPFLR